MITVCRNGDIRQLVIPVKKTGNTCGYTFNVSYTPGVVFDSFLSPYGSYSAGVISIVSLVHGMEFDMVLNVRITDISQINFAVTVQAVATPGCDTVITNNTKTFNLQKGTSEQCVTDCSDVTSEACTQDIAYGVCDGIPGIQKTLPKCFQCSDGFTNSYEEVSNENVLSWTVNPTTRVITIYILDPAQPWTLTLQTNCVKDNCVYGPYGPFTLSGHRVMYSVVYFTDSEGNRLTCDCFDVTKLYISKGEEQPYNNYESVDAIAEDIGATIDVNLCWQSQFCVFVGYVTSGSEVTQSYSTRLWVPFVDTDGDCPDFCDEDELDYSKFQKIDLTPYGGSVVSVANDGAVVSAFAALPTPLTVVVEGCGVLITNWICGNSYPNVEVVHTTAPATIYLEDGVGTNLTYTNINTTVGFTGMSYDLSAYGGGTHELLITGPAIAARLNTLMSTTGWVWQDNSGSNTSKLYHPSLSTAFTVTDIPTQRLIHLIDTNEGITGDGINGYHNGVTGTNIDYSAFTSVNFAPVGGSVTAIQDDGDIVTTMAGLGKTINIIDANIHIENWSIGTGYSNLEVSFLYDCWSKVTECNEGTSNNINVDGVDYPYGATAYNLLPNLLATLGIPGFVAAHWDVAEATIYISFRHGMGGINVDISESCESTLELDKTETANSTSCVEL